MWNGGGAKMDMILKPGQSEVLRGKRGKNKQAVTMIKIYYMLVVVYATFKYHRKSL